MIEYKNGMAGMDGTDGLADQAAQRVDLIVFGDVRKH